MRYPLITVSMVVEVPLMKEKLTNNDSQNTLKDEDPRPARKSCNPIHLHDAARK
jgi:hypothetical protein